MALIQKDGSQVRLVENKEMAPHQGTPLLLQLASPGAHLLCGVAVIRHHAAGGLGGRHCDLHRQRHKIHGQRRRVSSADLCHSFRGVPTSHACFWRREGRTKREAEKKAEAEKKKQQKEKERLEKEAKKRTHRGVCCCFFTADW